MNISEAQIESDILSYIEDNIARVGDELDLYYDQMSPKEKLNAWLVWNGMIYWTDKIIEVVRFVGGTFPE